MPRPPLLIAVLLAMAACASGGEAGPAAGPEQIALAHPSAALPAATWSAWPQAGRDARRSGTSSAVGPQSAHLRWSRTLEGNVTPGPVVAPDGSIIAASNAGVLHALDPATGADRWTFDGGGGYGSDLSSSAAVLPDGTVLWPGPHSTLWALTADGHLHWQLKLPGMPTSPAVSPDGHRVVVGDSTGTVTALQVDGADHRQLWQVDLGGSSYGSVALDPHDPTVTYDTVDDQVVALHEATVAWRFTAAAIIEVSPAVAPDGTVVVGSNDRYEYALHPDGTVAWRYQRGAQSYSSPVVGEDGVAWFGDHAAYVTGVDVGSGRRVARARGEHVEPRGGPSVGVWTAPVLDARHDLYWGTRLGHVYGQAADGRRLFDLDLKATVDSYPALTGDGALVVGVTDGRLLAIGG